MPVPAQPIIDPWKVFVEILKTLKMAWPVIVAFAGLAAIKIYMMKQEAAERRAKREARIYKDERIREQARIDTREAHKQKNR